MAFEILVNFLFFVAKQQQRKAPQCFSFFTFTTASDDENIGYDLMVPSWRIVDKLTFLPFSRLRSKV